jgi:protein involved in polysaccharide export with SLBB domain
MLIRRLVLASLVIAGAAHPCQAQAPAPAPAQSTPARPAQPAVDSRTAAAPVVLLDHPVSRSEYVLGPGDVLGISVFGEASVGSSLLNTSVTVSPEGTIVIPGIGVTQVLGLHLDQAEERVRALVARLYRAQEVRLTLEAVRSFRVIVSGDAETRGARATNAASRASELVSDTGRTGAWRRNVMLRRASGDSLRLDFASFALSGDLRRNPTLREGDELHVPVADQTVTLTGTFAFPGVYEFVPGESLAELVQLANGGQAFPANAADTIRISRSRDGARREVLPISVADATGARGRAFAIQPFDMLFSAERANFRAQAAAEVKGQVRFPGTYPVRAETTTVRELVALAGGLTTLASVENATLQRQPVFRPIATRELLTAPDSALSREDRQIKRIVSQSNGATYLAVDLAGVLRGEPSVADPLLEDGDVLTIPIRRDEVAVLGAVIRPGVTHYEAGLTVAQYVDRAGGFSSRADEGAAVVIRGGLGTRVPARDAKSLSPGDQIVVPYEVSRTRLESFQLYTGIFGSISSLIFAIYALTKLRG